MVEEMSSNARTNLTLMETSSSNNSENCTLSIRPSKRARQDNEATCSTRFKGVVPQQNGHWGAQIYANHQRVWLGTFKSEKEAAMAYDSAAIKLRSGDSHRNLPWTDLNVQEPDFQNLYTPKAILNMIRDGSYQSKFSDFLRIQSDQISFDHHQDTMINKITIHDHHRQISCVQLFQKELTPSDVSKLNRLVIPKRYAVKYFPYISDNPKHDSGENGTEQDIELVFFDKMMRPWKFRYCYWRSSQSFVFTRGWNRFVKEKNLKEKDVIIFYTCDHQSQDDHGVNTSSGQNTFFLIDVKHHHYHHHYNHHSSTSEKVDLGVKSYDELKLELNLEKNFSFKLGDNHNQDDHNHDHRTKRLKEERLESTRDLIGDKGFTLFGVKIS
ncbi:AP2/ERF and B3 domain-containing transcription factor At1g50680-like [Carica papaya]|uniref:AP2/ERF and B3 domain-containing transcription factor At1g50680-like n=1 Tax=Carica papaya TaxID=3649 RepID=UPI000B8CD31C|nr:AP2/ERF and B3 domain-containing transcription factor At1g50680-like [Carica papaya]